MVLLNVLIKRVRSLGRAKKKVDSTVSTNFEAVFPEVLLVGILNDF